MNRPPHQWDDLWSTDRDRQNAAYQALMAETGTAVGWASAAWSDTVDHLGDRDNHNRAIAAQLLCNLASTDATARVLDDLPALIAVTRDPKFVTARHCLQSLWKIGLAGPDQRRALVQALDDRYRESMDEKNGTLIRNDIIAGLRRLSDAVDDPHLEPIARVLIELEPDAKYRKKYAAHWR